MARLTNGGIIGKVVTTPTVNAAIGKWNIQDQHIYKQQNIWTGGIVQNGLIWHLDASNTSSYPGSGTTWTDLTGSGKNVTLTNCTYVTNDGGGISLNGTSSYGIFNMPAITTAYTIEAMVYLNTYNTDASGSSDIMMCTNSAGTHGLLLEVDAGPRWRNVHRFPYGNSPDDQLLTANGTVSNNTKYHVLVSRDGSTSQKLYINGSEVATLTPAYGGFDTNLTLGTIGRLNQTGASRYWQGYFYQFRIYNRGLTAAEASQNFNAIRGKFGL